MSSANAFCLGVIPARYASTRFPGKPLVEIAGKTMVQRVYEQAQKAASLDRVIVATDDHRILENVRSFGGEVMMTSPDHACGTDRLAEVARAIPEAGIVVNIQGDEPLIAPESIDLAVQRLLDSPGAAMSTLVSACAEHDFPNPNVVKAVLDKQGFALYFSRSPIPFPRNPEGGARPWRHIGLYAYRREFLMAFAAMPSTPLEQTETLEQLRALENGYRIACAVSPYESVGVDTPEELARVEAILGSRVGKLR